MDSVATSLAIYWGQEIAKAGHIAGYEDEFSAPVLPGDLALKALAAASAKLAADFGTWQTPWGNINRFQRLTGRYCAATSTMPSQARRWGLRLPPGARWPRSGPGLIQGQRSGTEPAETALLRWWSLGTKCAPGR